MTKINGINLELPKYTIDIAEKLEEYDEVKRAVFDSKMKFTDGLRRYYEILVEILGAEKTAEVVAGETIENVDITKLCTAFISIIDYYKSPIEKAENEVNRKKFREAFNTPELKEVTKLVDTVSNL